MRTKQQKQAKPAPETITMTEVSRNLHLAAMEYRAGVYEKKRVYEYDTLMLGLQALQVNERAKKTADKAKMNLYLSLVLYASSLLMCLLASY